MPEWDLGLAEPFLRLKPESGPGHPEFWRFLHSVPDCSEILTHRILLPEPFLLRMLDSAPAGSEILAPSMYLGFVVSEPSLYQTPIPFPGYSGFWLLRRLAETLAVPDPEQSET